MRVKFLGAAQIVSGSCFLLEVGSSKILVDCGLFHGPKEIKERNYGKFPIPPSSVDYILLTHAHIDHSGLIPKIIKHGFRGRIIATSATLDLCEVLLPDCGHIQEMECERKNRKNKRAGRKLIEPIYTAEDGLEAMKYFIPVKYNEFISITPQVTVRFLDAGHILGSSLLEILVQEGEEETKLVFSGDLGNNNQPFINDPSFIFNADYVFLESTYGNRLHKNKDDKKTMLKQAIIDTYKKGGNLIIPAFAVGRTQDIIYEIAGLQRKGEIPILPIYIDSPMAIKATQIFDRHPNVYDEKTTALVNSGNHPLRLENLYYSITADESRELNTKLGCNIIISASGMCDAGRVKHHLRHNLWREESTVLIVGYQAIGTLGRRLLDGESFVRIHGEEVVVRADIRVIDGYSAHADQRGILEWLGNFQKMPRRVFLVHGEPESQRELANLVRQQYNIPVSIPEYMEEVELTTTAAANVAILRDTYSSVAKKLDHLLQTGIEPERCEVLLNQLKQLERWLDNAV